MNVLCFTGFMLAARPVRTYFCLRLLLNFLCWQWKRRNLLRQLVGDGMFQWMETIIVIFMSVLLCSLSLSAYLCFSISCFYFPNNFYFLLCCLVLALLPSASTSEKLIETRNNWFAAKCVVRVSIFSFYLLFKMEKKNSERLMNNGYIRI